ncbi:Pentatricopeptide repeat-containing protein [Hibiscus syriacus]|uniref:Pentatricopeptide repeat-containing protein n=1 Tax=Hibiscus syriacus TaxID=106335 RepID=A0A6A3AJN4_HIBSY|nr:Pentatricopeptide repeat-containing protein [Hibiscus syriacus]
MKAPQLCALGLTVVPGLYGYGEPAHYDGLTVVTGLYGSGESTHYGRVRLDRVNRIGLRGYRGSLIKSPQLFDEIPKKYEGVYPDKVSYGILIKAYCEAGNPEKGLEVLREMERKSIEVTTVTFTTILNALYKKGKTEEAEKLWFEMTKTGCELDVAACNVRISSDPEKVKELIDGMSSLGLEPDTISYNYLMTSYFKRGMLDEAKKVYEGLESYKVFKETVRFDKVPDFNTLKHLAEGLVMKKKTKDTKGLIRTVKKTFPPNFLNAWTKLEKELGLSSCSAGNAEAQEAKESTG